MYNQQHHSIVVLKSTFYEFRRMTSFSSNSDYPTFASSYTLFHSISLCRYNTIIFKSKSKQYHRIDCHLSGCMFLIASMAA